MKSFAPHPEIFGILRKLHSGTCSPQQAMTELVPYLMACKTQSELSELEPAKKYIVNWQKRKIMESDEHLINITGK